VAQVKKPEVRRAILDAAAGLFAERGYHGTTMQAVASGAGVSVANVYVYFASKLDLLFAIYDPWMRARLVRLEAELAALRAPRARIRHLLHTIWRAIPEEENGFVVNIMQALSTATPAEGWRPTLVGWMEARVAGMIVDALPEARRAAVDAPALAHLAIMALDGFAIQRRLDPGRACDDRTLDWVTALLLDGGGASVGPARSGGDARPASTDPVNPAPRRSSKIATASNRPVPARAARRSPVRPRIRSPEENPP
jgi:AcrR family transcriptional regulator